MNHRTSNHSIKSNSDVQVQQKNIVGSYDNSNDNLSIPVDNNSNNNNYYYNPRDLPPPNFNNSNNNNNMKEDHNNEENNKNNNNKPQNNNDNPNMNPSLLWNHLINPSDLLQLTRESLIKNHRNYNDPIYQMTKEQFFQSVFDDEQNEYGLSFFCEDEVWVDSSDEAEQQALVENDEKIINPEATTSLQNVSTSTNTINNTRQLINDNRIHNDINNNNNNYTAATSKNNNNNSNNQSSNQFDQNNNQVNIKYEYHNSPTNHTNGPLINGNDGNISHLSLKDFADNNFYRRSGPINVNDGSYRQQPISSYNFNEMYEQWNVKSDVM